MTRDEAIAFLASVGARFDSAEAYERAVRKLMAPMLCGTCGVEVYDAGDHAENAGHWPTKPSRWIGAV